MEPFLSVVSGLFAGAGLAVMARFLWSRSRFSRANEPLMPFSELERRVKVRTSQLVMANEDLQAEVADGRRAQEALRTTGDQFRQIFTTIPIPVWLYNVGTLKFVEVNDTAITHYGFSRDEFLSMEIDDILPKQELPPVHWGHTRGMPVCKHQTRDGRIIDVELSSHLIDYEGKKAVLVAALDVTQRKQMEVELRHAQKLEAVGSLAAGIAHEINTPIQFVSDNTRFLKDAFLCARELIGKYEELYEQARNGQVNEQTLDEIHSERENADWEYLREEIPRAVEQMLDGIGRVARIVRAMKEFSHVDQSTEKLAADLNKALESTLVVARNELKYVADVEVEFGELPSVLCHIGDLNQVFLNLLINAAHAIADVVKDTNSKGKISVRTRQDGECVEIAISDTGTGIPDAIRNKVFEPFFTTKEVGKGTGQGLALARAVVVEKHGGTLNFESEVGKGTTFFVRLPVNGVSHTRETVAVH